MWNFIVTNRLNDETTSTNTQAMPKQHLKQKSCYKSLTLVAALAFSKQSSFI